MLNKNTLVKRLERGHTEIKECKSVIVTSCGSTVVDQSPHHPKVVGLSPGGQSVKQKFMLSSSLGCVQIHNGKQSTINKLLDGNMYPG